MENTKTTATLSSVGIPLISILLGIGAIAITENIYIGLSVFIISFAYMFTDVIGLIPFVGVYLQYVVLNNYVIPFMTTTFTIPPSVLVLLDIAFWISIIIGGIVTILSSIVVVAYIYFVLINK